MRLAALLSLMPILLAGCRGDVTPVPEAPAPLSQEIAGTSWQFVEARAVLVAEPRETQLAFDASGQASGTTGCNRFSGAAAITDGRLMFSPLVTTRRGCPPELAEQEARILGVLEEVRGYEVRADGLWLLLEDGTPLARLEPAAEPVALTPGEHVALRGALAEGTECPMLVLDDGRRVSLTGERAGHAVGARVCVRGTVVEMSICMAGEATVSIESIGPESDCP